MSAAQTINVVITGASSGIGRDLARNLAKSPAANGARFSVLLVARRESELTAAVAECNEAAGTAVAHYAVADVTKRADVDRVAVDAAKAFGGAFHVWINCAGRGLNKRAIDLTDEDIDDMMSINVKSALYGMQAATKAFVAAGSPATGHIINVSSILGRCATFAAIRSGYNGAKHFLNAITDNFRQDLQSDEATKDIAVTVVSPGPVATEFGLNAGSADSRANPNAQDVAEVSEVIRACIADRREEAYTRDVDRVNINAFIAGKGLPSASAQ
jgi:short-subunit dehydrogenase